MLFEMISPAADDTAQGNAVRAAIDRVHYLRNGSNPYDAGATAVVEIIQEGIVAPVIILTGVNLNASALWRPRTDVHDSVGAVIAGQVTRHVLAEARVRVTITGGGSGVGTFLVTFDRR